MSSAANATFSIELGTVNDGVRELGAESSLARSLVTASAQPRQDDEDASALASPSAPANRHPYLEYIGKLSAAWKDAPQLNVSFRDVSVVFPKPLRFHPPPAEGVSPADVKPHVPNLLSTLRHWAAIPVELAKDKLGLATDPPLYSLQGINGTIRPGSMTLVLAPPGHGKSTFLKLLSGRVPESDIRGELLFNGRSLSQLRESGVHIKRMAAYVGQLDLHFPSLTVRETLKFATDSSVPPASLLGAAATPELLEGEKNRADMLVDLLGLNECRNTIVGSDMMRGVSGGQKKRVTLGEMIAGDARLFCLDEVSSGLDASVTASIFGNLRQLCHVSGSSVVTALLQPTPDTYALFDQIVLLHEGRLVYSGPRSDVKRWLWQVCGVDVPVDVDEASFLVDFLVNPQMAYESAQLIAQSRSFIEVTRPARQADTMMDEEEQKDPASVHKHKHVAPEPTSPNRDPDLYENYKTFTQVADQADVSEVTFHVEGEEEEGQASGPSSQREPQQKKPAVVIDTVQREASASNHSDHEPALAKQNLLTPPNAAPQKRLGGKFGARQHSTLPAKPVRDMKELEQRYQSSRWHQSMMGGIDDASSEKVMASMDPRRWSAYTRANFAQVNPKSYGAHMQLCFSRQFKLFKRNLTVLVPRITKALSIGCLYGLLFFQLAYGDFTEKLAVAMYGCIFAAMTNLSELPVASEARNVISKQLDAGFFPSSPYTFAVAAMHIPLTAFESIAYSLLIYFISGMAMDAGRFFFYVFVCFICSNAMSVFYRFISYITPNPDVAKQLDLPFVVLFLMLNGWIIVYGKIPAWLRYWIFWVAPLQWGTKALSYNEYSHSKYDIPCASDPSKRQGDCYLESFDLPTDHIWQWMGVVYLIGWYIIWMAICILALNHVSLISPLGSERETYEEEKVKRSDEEERAQLPAPMDLAIPIDSKPAVNPAFQLSALPFTPVTLAWSDLDYSVQLADGSTRTLLHGVSGFGAPGQMTALMGASGAGKTTLMDCIAGRKTTGTLKAKVLVNGKEVDIHSSYFQRLCGYVEQTDLHIGTSTVEEAFRFSARLRLPTSVPIESQHKFVREVMDLLGLTPFAHSMIGDAAIPGLAPAQLKLVTIGVELVANPAILFLDEPTSGLDAPAAWRVMAAIQRIALTGRVVVCTIHQPAARIFFLFDRLLLLQPGGKTVYFHSIGSRGETLVSYLEASTHFEQKLPAGVNPGDWMLDVTHPSSKQVWPDVWTSSKLYKEQVKPEIDRAINPASYQHLPAHNDNDAYAGWLTRYDLVQRRLFTSYWRNGPMNLTRTAVVIIVSLILGLIYYKVRPTDYAGLQSILAGIYMTLGFGPSLPCSAALPTLFRQRAVYYRESTVRMYDYLAYALSMTVAEFFTLSILMFVYVVPFYFLMGLADNGNQFWRMYLILFLLSQIYAFICQLYLAMLPTQVAASVVHSIVFSFFFVFGGLLVTANAFPAGWKWFYHTIPTPKAFTAIALQQLSCSDSTVLKGGFGCYEVTMPDAEHPQRVQELVEDMMELDSGCYGDQVGWLILSLFVFKMITLLAFRFISHLKR